MESGDDMSVSEKMTGLMNAVRGVTGVTRKLDVSDATNSLSSLTSNSIHWSTIDLTDGYDANTWYPVISSKGSVNQLDRIIVNKSLYGSVASKPATWGTRGDKHVPCVLDLLASANGYGTLPTYVYLFANQVRFADKAPVVFDVITTDSKYLLWLRGGTDYHVGISLPDNVWKVYADGYTTNNKLNIVPENELPTSLSIVKKSQDTLGFVDFQKLGGAS